MELEVEHIIPTSRGGTNRHENLALACRSCNIYKGDALQGTDPDTHQSAPLFHPRRDRWSGHFTVDLETGAICGLTPTGRATVLALRMNRPMQTAARKQWMRLGVFP